MVLPTPLLLFLHAMNAYPDSCFPPIVTKEDEKMHNLVDSMHSSVRCCAGGCRVRYRELNGLENKIKVDFPSNKWNGDVEYGRMDTYSRSLMLLLSDQH